MTTAHFTKTTFNVGDHARIEDLIRVCDPDRTDATVLNEMYNRHCQRLLDELQSHYGDRIGLVEFPDVEGARANPLVYSTRTLDLKDAQHYRVLRAGTRAGKHNMQKNLVGGVFRFEPVPCRMNLFGKHAIQTQGPDVRRRAAIRQSVNEVDILGDRTAITMVSGDWNAVPGKPSLRPYHDWASTQAADPMDTFKDRNIDGTMWHGPRQVPGVQIRFLGNQVLHGTNSDHRPIRALFEIEVKPW